MKVPLPESAYLAGLSFAGLVAYNLSFQQPQGRLLFAALTGIALIFATGVWGRLVVGFSRHD